MTATPTKAVRLEAASASGGKFYTVTINPAGVTVGTFPNEVTKLPGFTVDFTYGAVGDTPRTGTKTKTPVTLGQAEAIFDKLVKEKMQGESHYQIVDGAGAGIAMTPVVKQPEGNLPQCYPPRLLNDVDPGEIIGLTQNPDWWVQLKHDGDRVQLHASDGYVTLFSGRSAKVRACPAAIQIAASKYPVRIVLDGELVGETLWVFDVLFEHLEDRRPLAYHHRYNIAESIVRSLNCPTIKLVGAATSEKGKKLEILNARDKHAEGICFINRNAPYTVGRPNKGGMNLRWKFRASASLIVMAHNHAKGKESISVGLYGEDKPIGTCSVIGKTAYEVGTCVEVLYLYCQGSLVQCVLKGQRPDVRPEDCTRSQIKFKDGIDPLKAVK